MLRSMTGYGEATVESESFVLAVETKSVNNRFLKIVAKIPEEVSYLQNEFEERVRKSLPRGSVSFTVRFTPTRCADLYDIDDELLEKYLHSMERLAKKLGRDEEIRLKDLLLLPGVVRTEEALVLGKDVVLPFALRAMDGALRGLLAMREAEGRLLEEDFRKRAETLRGLLEEVRREAPRAVDDQRRKLEERVNLLLSEKGVALSAEDVLREVALLADRSDITEEIERFHSHLVQFVDSLESPQPVGRKLEFVLQEMAREANTMGSKSSGMQLGHSIVEIKAEVDRLKEQVMNVE
jgi:uncharacterized protein (TIGR00255 family)